MLGIETMTAATIGGAMIFGMALALLGRLKFAAEQRVPVEDGSPRRCLLALNVALVPLVLLSGVLLDIYGARPLLVAGSVMLAVALVIHQPAAQARAAPLLALRAGGSMTAMLLAGFGTSALGTASIVLMPRAFFVSEETSAGLNLGFAFLALGAVLTSVLADILHKTIGLRRTLAGFALLALTPAFLGVLPYHPNPALPQVGGGWGGGGNPSTLLAEPACWLAALALFFYVPLESAISLWTGTLLAECGEGKRETSVALLSGFWAAFLASRLLAALAQHLEFLMEWWDRGLIVAAPLLAAVLLGNLAGAGQHGRPRGGLILLGLLLGPVLPTLLGLVFQAAPEAKGTAYGLVFTAGSLGSILFAPFLSLRLPIFLALLVAAVALVLGLMLP